MARIAQDGRSALGELYDRYGRIVFGILIPQPRAAERAEEVASTRSTRCGVAPGRIDPIAARSARGSLRSRATRRSTGAAPRSPSGLRRRAASTPLPARRCLRARSGPSLTGAAETPPAWQALCGELVRGRVAGSGRLVAHRGTDDRLVACDPRLLLGAVTLSDDPDGLTDGRPVFASAVPTD